MQIAFGHIQNMTALERGLPSCIAVDDERVLRQKNGRDVRRTNLVHGLFDNPTDRMILDWKFENSVDLVWFEMRVIQDCAFGALLAPSHRKIATSMNFPARAISSSRSSIAAQMVLGLIALQVCGGWEQFASQAILMIVDSPSLQPTSWRFVTSI